MTAVPPIETPGQKIAAYIFKHNCNEEACSHQGHFSGEALAFMIDAEIAKAAMGDASTRKDEGRQARSEQPADSPSEISDVEEEPEPEGMIPLSYHMKIKEMLEGHLKNAHERIGQLYATVPVLSKPDPAEALSRAILKAHAKWAAEYQGVGHAG